jgi:hypothetical protein
MEAKIMLHNDNKLFIDTVLATSEYFSISPIYIEKDYWITHVLRLMAQNDNANKVVFKGGTSLSKAYHLINRFSEDIDVAVIDAGAFTGNQLKTLIKKVAKEMTTDLQEIQVDGITSKGSHFYKAVYAYPNLLKQTAKTAVSSNLLVEINSFANPCPYETKTITSFIDDFGLHPLDNIARLSLLQILEDRYGKKSTLISSQLPVDKWHQYIGESTLADAIMN